MAGCLLGAVVAFTGVAMFVLVPQQAAAQFFDNRYPWDNRRSRPWFEPQQVPEEKPVDYSRAPAAQPRSADAPAPSTKILVIGDSMADWLAYGLEDAMSDTPEIQIVRKPRTYSGLIRYETRSDIEWAQVAKDLLAAEKPTMVLMTLGIQDRQSIREKVATPAKPAAQKKSEEPKKPEDQKKADEQKKTDDPNQDAEQTPVIATPEPPAAPAKPGGPYEFRSEKWEEVYTKRIDDTIAAMKSTGAAVVWVGLPALRGTKSTSDVSYLNELYRARAEKAGIFFVDVWDGFVDEQGRFVAQGPDVEGQTRRLRTADGVHFTKYGARKLAHYVERELRRVLLNRNAPAVAALPTPEKVEPQTPAKPGVPAPRPLAGPVLYLNSKQPADSGELLGGPGTRQTPDDATARRVLVNGNAATAAVGRADDFSWPLRSPNTQVNEPLPPTGAPVVASAPVAPAATAPAAPKPAQPGAAARVAGQPVMQGQYQGQPGQPGQGPRGGPQAQWRTAPQYYRPPQNGFFGLFR